MLFKDFVKQLRMKQREVNGILGDHDERIGVHLRYSVFFPGGLGDIEVVEVVTPRVKVMRMRDSRLARVLGGVTARHESGEFAGEPLFVFLDDGFLVLEWWKDASRRGDEVSAHVAELGKEGIVLVQDDGGGFHDEHVSVSVLFEELDSVLEEL